MLILGLLFINLILLQDWLAITRLHHTGPSAGCLDGAFAVGHPFVQYDRFYVLSRQLVLNQIFSRSLSWGVQNDSRICHYVAIFSSALFHFDLDIRAWRNKWCSAADMQHNEQRESLCLRGSRIALVLNAASHPARIRQMHGSAHWSWGMFSRDMAQVNQKGQGLLIKTSKSWQLAMLHLSLQLKAAEFVAWIKRLLRASWLLRDSLMKVSDQQWPQRMWPNTKQNLLRMSHSDMQTRAWPTEMEWSWDCWNKRITAIPTLTMLLELGM